MQEDERMQEEHDAMLEKVEAMWKMVNLLEVTTAGLVASKEEQHLVNISLDSRITSLEVWQEKTRLENAQEDDYKMRRALIEHFLEQAAIFLEERRVPVPQSSQNLSKIWTIWSAAAPRVPFNPLSPCHSRLRPRFPPPEATEEEREAYPWRSGYYDWVNGLERGDQIFIAFISADDYKVVASDRNTVSHPILFNSKGLKVFIEQGLSEAADAVEREDMFNRVRATNADFR